MVYTTKDFVRDTQEFGVYVEDFPRDMDIDEVAKKFGDLEIELSVPHNINWFYGWFPKDVRNLGSDEVLATVHGGSLDDPMCSVRFTEKGREYLTD
jgi:hypothetical protein|tara:strand:- start:748 stop:1035 length:288 start_codon:yes stop_codon:yes gene_type:complete